MDPFDARKSLVIPHAIPLWVEGLPLGNGDLGVVLFGGAEQLTLAFNKQDCWDARVNPGQGLPEDQASFDEVVAMAAREDWAAYNRLFKGWLGAENSSRPSLQSCGQLALQLVPGERPVGVLHALDLASARAVARVETVDYRDNRQSVELAAFVPAGENTVPIAVSSRDTLWGTLRLWRPHSRDYGPPRAWREGDTAGLDMAFPGGAAFTLAVRVLKGEGVWEATAHEAVCTLPPQAEGGGELVLLATVVTGREASDPRRAALERLRAADAGAPDESRERHERWWREFWSRSDVSLPDERLERFWRLGLYVLASCSREGKKAPGLQGLWNQYNRPCWHTDYHADMNIQMIYWPAYVGNHLDLTGPYYRLLTEDWLGETRRAARDFFRRRGMYLPIAGGPAGHELAGPWMWPGAGAWLAQHFAWHWMYSRDPEFLRRVYPYLKELSLFYEDFLQKSDEGVYNFGPSYAPEMPDPRGYLAMAWGRNPTGDLAFVRILFALLAEAAQALGVDAADRARWADIRDNLAGYPVGPDGRLRDLEGDRWAPMGPMPVTLAPLYPAGDVGPDSPSAQRDLLREAYARARARFAGGGHLMMWFAAAAAHLGDAEDALKLLNEYLDLTVLENGLHVLRWVPHFREGDKASGMMQIEATTAFSNAIQAMLLQSLDGVIRVFPAVPPSWSVSFETLRASGAFLVSARREPGRTTRVRILSERGGTCRLADPFGAGRAEVQDSRGRVQPLTTDSHGHFSFATEAGAAYELSR